jgi:hypothetical protein
MTRRENQIEPATSQVSSTMVSGYLRICTPFHATPVEVLGDPCHWATAWNGLRNTSNANSDHYAVQTLDFYFLSEFLQAQQEDDAAPSHFYYLDQRNVALIKAGRDAPSTPVSACTQNVVRPPLTFMMVEHRQTLFYVLLNIQRHEALLIYIGENHEQKIAEQPWFQAIWEGVIMLFGWTKRCSNSPTILYGGWIAVCHLHLAETNSCHACLTET